MSLLVSGALEAAVTAPLLYAFVRVTSGLVAFALRVWPLLGPCEWFNAIATSWKNEHIICSSWGRSSAGSSRYLDRIGLLEPALSFGKTVLAARLERGAISISIGDILAFFLTVWAAYALSAFIRFVLEEGRLPADADHRREGPTPLRACSTTQSSPSGS